MCPVKIEVIDTSHDEQHSACYSSAFITLLVFGAPLIIAPWRINLILMHCSMSVSALMIYFFLTSWLCWCASDNYSPDNQFDFDALHRDCLCINNLFFLSNLPDSIYASGLPDQTYVLDICKCVRIS